jgi:hypothetical protein
MKKLLFIFLLTLTYYGCDTANADYKRLYEQKVAEVQMQATIIANLETLKTVAFRRIDSLKTVIATMPDSNYWFDYVYNTRTYPMLTSINDKVTRIVDSLRYR